ncbi:MAG TPA: cell surface protein SprA, partial [Chitinophagales bacterium]|nr:cell surface protein SprA [Chitinophagales bacterium]
LADKYVYDQLYDSTKVIAQQFPQYNRFVLKGTFKSSVSNEISLGAFNIPQGSVKVTAGGQVLTEGKDYTIDYSLGRVKIINEGVLNSGVPINVSYENNALFGFQTKTMFGMRADYKVNDKFSWGGTLLHLRERPFTQKVNIGEDPIKNLQWGLDANYNTESQFLTWLVDKLPLYETKEPSSFSLYTEMAHLKPGHQRAIGKDGTVYIDDFEGTTSSYDLKHPVPNWVLASTPKNALSKNGRILFPEAELTNDLRYGFNRAKLAWYNIDPLFLRNNSATPSHIANSPQQKNAYTREVPEQEVFPNKTSIYQGINTNIPTFDLAFYPREKGPYNFETKRTLYSAGVLSDGSLDDPETRWGGIMRSLDNTDFESSNTEYIEFWIQDPFIYNPNSSGGELYINLGNISEDILKDSRKFFENGLQEPGSTVPVDTTAWGVVPRNQPITNSFDNDVNKRQYQDLGLDGLNDNAEKIFHQDYLDTLAGIVNSSALLAAQNDPSNDNYHYYRGDDYDAQQKTILERYLKYNNPQGNSPVSGTGQTVSEAATNSPDSEDLNRDFTLNETEEYFQYRVELSPAMDDKFITDKVTNTVELDIGPTEVSWYQFKIPIDEYERKVGNISDFKSIRFMRMFLTGFEDSVIVRFARLELVRNQWRRYRFSLLEPGEYIPDDESSKTFFSVSSVNVEENSEKQPIPYALPPGIEREQNLSTTNYSALQNEQSLQVLVCDLKDGDSRAVYKTLNLDLRTYKRLKMFIHGESYDVSDPVQNGDVRVFIRLGSDFTNNYYEYELPLTVTPPGNYDPLSDASREAIWPEANEIDLPLDSFYRVKVLRDAQPGADPTSPFVITDSKGNRFTVVGNPDLGLVKTAMLGIRNPKATLINGTLEDDGRPKCAEVWFNEFRLTGLDEEGGWAATARMETKLADLGGFTFSALTHSIGYGQIEQKVQERYKDNFWQYDFAGNIELGKFLPEKAGLRIPMYGGISQKFSTPEFDPYELDVPLSDKLSSIATGRRDYKRQVQARETIKSLNFTNVRFVPARSDKKIRFYHPSNLNFTFAYTNTVRSTAFIESDQIKKYKASMGYNFSPQAKYLTPFGKAIRSKSKYLDIIRDININFIPNSLSFSTDFNRQFGETRLRIIDDELPPDPTYEKYFTWDRIYGLKYNPFKSLTLDFNAINNAAIDEPPGRLDTKEKKDSVWSNIFEGGRTTRYQHNFSASYNAPLNKIPAIDWLQARGGYTTSYTWITGTLYRDLSTGLIGPNPLGNIISNTRDIKLNGEVDFKKFYEKFRLLRPYNSSKARTEQDWKKKERDKKASEAKKKREKIDSDIEKLKKEIEKLSERIRELKKDTIPSKGEEIKKLKKERKEKKQRIRKLQTDKNKIINPESPAVSPFVRPFIALKRVSVNYGINNGTTVPGFLPRTKIIGLTDGFTTPGLNFVFGYQPTQRWLDDAASKGWITADTNLNYQVLQFTTRTLDAKATVEPFRDFKVDLTLTKSVSENYSEYFKKQFTTGPFGHLTPTTTGSYTVSYIAVRTMFRKADDQGFTEAFRQFQDDYRSIISARLASGNPNSTGNFQLPSDTGDVDYSRYRYGYGPYSQDVLIPAFIAAYRGKDIGSISLDPFDVFPLPNWRITYNGLSNIPFMKKAVNTINITHGYTSTYTVNSYITDLYFEGNGYFQPSKIDSLSNNFISYYSIPQVVITEQFSPLIGVDITWKNNMTTKFDFKKTRNLALGLVDYQVSESKTTEVTFGFGYRLKGLTLPFKFKGKKKKLPNEINFKFDFSFRDNVTFNQRLDQQVSEPTRGMKTIRVSPSIDYVINNRLNIRIFFDRNRSIPATSASYPITNTKAGVTLRFSLMQ